MKLPLISKKSDQAAASVGVLGVAMTGKMLFDLVHEVSFDDVKDEANRPPSLLAMATIGAIDGTYYHTLKFRLYDQPSARLETVTHVFRAWSMAFAVWLLAHHVPVGGWYWALVAVFAVLTVNVGLTYILAPRYGALGAAAAYTGVGRIR